MLIDPNAWSADGTTRLAAFAPSRDARYRRLRSLAQRFGLAAIQGDGAGHQEDAARHDRVGQSVRRRVARRRFLLQPLSRSTAGSGEGVDKREPPGVFPQGRHRRSPRTSWSIRTRRIRSVSTLSRRPRTNGSRSSTISERGKGKDGNALHIRDLSRGEAKFRPVVPIIGDDSYRRGRQRRTTSCSCRRTARRRTGEWFSIDPAHPEETNWKDVLPEKPEPLDGVSHGGRETVCDLPEGRDDPRIRLRVRRQARERGRDAGARQRAAGSAARTTRHSCSTPSTR